MFSTFLNDFFSETTSAAVLPVPRKQLEINVGYAT